MNGAALIHVSSLPWDESTAAAVMVRGSRSPHANVVAMWKKEWGRQDMMMMKAGEGEEGRGRLLSTELTGILGDPVRIGFG